MTIPVRRLAACLLVAGSALVAVPAAPAGAVRLEQSAWWSRANTTTPTAESPQPIPGGNPVVPTLPAPPTVGADQFRVEGTPAGATAIAGLRWMLDEGETSPVLTLTPTPESTVPPTAVVLACRAAIEWQPPATSPGPWETKPLADCATSVQGQIQDDGRLLFPLLPLLRGSDLDVLIVPGTMPELPPEARGSSFGLTFERPGPDALVTTRGSSAGEETFSPPNFDTSFEPAPPSDEFIDGPAFVAPDLAPTFDGSVVPSATPVVEPALEPQEQAPSVPRTIVPAASLAEDAAGAAKQLGLVLLALGAIFAFLSTGEQPVEALGLGRFRRPRPEISAVVDSDPTEGGIGRMRRLRVGQPPRL